MHTAKPFRPRGVALLLRYKGVALRNRLTQLMRESPFRVLFVVAVLGVIWGGLYVLFVQVFAFVRAETFQGIVAIPLILDFFFMALMVMLVFSNGVIAYGSLFAQGEPEYLLSQPLDPSTVTLFKLLESLLLSSWSLVLVGLPLMAAVARGAGDLPASYCPFFAAFFLAFIPIPGAIGLLAAWAIGFSMSRLTRRVLWGAAIVAVLAGLTRLGRTWTAEQLDSGRWLKDFFERASLMQGAFWPSTWVSKGLGAVREAELADAFFYLFVTASTGVFCCWLAVRVVGHRLMPAYDRVRASGGGGRYDGRRTRRLAAILFWYMSDDLREIALKDLRSFLRDPMQWSQQLILLGLLGIYVLNIRDVPMKINAFGMQLAISFLNLAAVSLLLATFTSRFVFPLISLEIQQLWLVGVLPMHRGRILLPKFCFALTVTFLAGAAVTLLASQLGGSSAELVLINLVVVAAVCAGLCGLAVGLGGRFPMIGERNPAKIASGLGGTLNLAISVTVVAGLLALCFVAGRHFFNMGMVIIDAATVAVLAMVVAGGFGVGLAAMKWGQRHFEQLEC